MMKNAQLISHFKLTNDTLYPALTYEFQGDYYQLL